MPCSDSLVGLFSFFLLCFAIASVQVGNAIKEPCQSINIKRTDTNEDVTSEVVLLDDITETPKSFSCGGEGWVWAPTARTDYIGFMSELSDIGTYAFNRIDSLIHTNLMFQSNGGHKEGFYYCTNAINFGCFVGAFQRNSLMPRDVCVNHITHTSFEVSWSKVTFTEYVRGYDLTVMSEGKVVYRERFPLSSTAAYNKKISCLEPGKQYVVKIDALYSFVSDRQEFLKISNSIPVTTPLGKASQECVDEMKSPVVDAKPHLRTNGTVNVTWTTPNNIKPTKSIIRYRNVLSSDTLEKVVEGSSTAVEINNLEMGATYMFSVAVHAASSSKRASHSVSRFSQPVYHMTAQTDVPLESSLFTATVLNSTSVAISWNTSKFLNSGCIPSTSHIDVFLRNDAGEESPVDSMIVHHPASRHTISNLHPYRKYRFQVRTVCDDGVHSHTSEAVSQTHPAAPSGMPNVIKVTLFSSIVVFNIKRPSAEQCNGEIVSYTLIYAKSGDESAEETEVQIVSLSCSDVTQYILEGLESGTEYKLKLSASTEAGSGPFTEWDMFTTLPIQNNL
jgi:hypothetical protein